MSAILTVTDRELDLSERLATAEQQRDEVIRMAREAGFAISDRACDEAVDKYRALIQAGQKIDGEPPAFQSEIRRLTAELESARSELAQLRELSTLAFRALNDVGPVLATVSGEDYSESAMLAELIDRVKACSLNLWCALRYPGGHKNTEVTK